MQAQLLMKDRTLLPEQEAQLLLSLFKNIRPFVWDSSDLKPAPNCALRGSLFGIVEKKAAPFKNKIVYQDEVLTIHYDGPQLGQCDFDVWLQILHLVGRRFFESAGKTIQISFNPTTFMRSINRVYGKRDQIGSSDREWLVTSLRRLKGTFTFQDTRHSKGKMVSLIHDVEWDDREKNLQVEVNRSVGWLFFRGCTFLSMKARKALTTDELALWLYSFILSCKTDRADKHFFYSVEKLRAMSRTSISSKEVRKFKYKIAVKLRKIMKIKSDDDFYHWRWDKSILHVFYTKDQYVSWGMKEGMHIEQLFSEHKMLLAELEKSG